jgi:hypothetical protein
MLAHDPVLLFDIRPFAILAQIHKDPGRADIRSFEQNDGLALLKCSVCQ